MSKEPESNMTIDQEFDNTWSDREFGNAERKKGWLENIAGICARKPWKVIIIWIVIATISGLYSLSLPSKLTTEMRFYGDKESAHALDAIDEYDLGHGEMVNELILVRSKNPNITAKSPEFIAKTKEIAKKVETQLQDVEGEAIKPLTLDALEAGHQPRPSVLGRQQIEELIEAKKAEITKKYEDRGDSLQAQVDDLEARGKVLKERGEAVQTASATAMQTLATKFGVTPQKMEQVAKLQAEQEGHAELSEAEKNAKAEQERKEVEDRAAQGDPVAIAEIANRNLDAAQEEYNHYENARKQGNDQPAAREAAKAKLDEAKAAYDRASANAEAFTAPGATITNLEETPQPPAQANPDQPTREEIEQQQELVRLWGAPARNPEFLGLLAQLDDLKKQGDILKIQQTELEQEGDLLKTQGDQLKSDGDKEKADGEAQQADLDKFLDQLQSKDEQATILIAAFDSTESQIPIDDWNAVIDTLSDDTYQVTSIGITSINKAFQVNLNDDLIKAELIGVPIALLVMIYVFRSLAGPLVPLMLGVIAIVTARGIVTGVATFSTQQIFIENVVSMLGLAVGIDYALFVVQRYNENRILGHGRIRAIERAAATSGKAVVFSGLTVAVSLSGVTLVPANIFASLGAGAVIIVMVAILAVITLLPAILSVYGGIINWPFGKRASQQEPITQENIFNGFWGKTTKLSVTHPWATMLTSIAILLTLAYPIFGMKMGFSSTLDLDRGVISQEWDYMQEEFAPGMLAPYQFVITGAKSQEAADELVEKLKDDPSIHSFQIPEVRDDGTAAYVEAIGSERQATLENYAVIDHWRDTVEKDIEKKYNVELMITGQAAAEDDMLQVLGPITPMVFAMVLSLSFILLMLAFRSIVVPIKAIIYNVLSVGATYGIMMLVFKHGWFINILGYEARPLIEAWLPIMLFCILFGLSMDYHVFILSRIREHYDISHNNKESVAVGLRATSRLITGAAAIMVVIFISFSFSSSIQLQQFGFGLAVAVFLDATLIRVFLVPSLMVLMREANWWLPRWLHWLPDLRIEGDPEDSALNHQGPVAREYASRETETALDHVEAISPDAAIGKFLGLESTETLPPPPGKLPPPPTGYVNRSEGTATNASWDELFGLENPDNKKP